MGFPYSSVGKESACIAGHPSLVSRSGKSPREGSGNSLQYFCLENLMDRGAWQATVDGVTRVGHDLATKPPTTCMKCSLGSLYWRDLIVFILLFSSISFHWSLRKAFLSLLVVLWNSAFKWVNLSFSPLPFASLLFTAIFKASSLVAQTVKRLSTMRKTWVRSLGQEDPLEKEMAIHSSTIAWKIPWTEEPGRLQSIRSQRIGHDWETSLSLSL